MKAKPLLRVTAPIVSISILPLALGMVVAWQLHQSQKQASLALTLDVAGMRAGEELAIDIREVRWQLDRFLLTNDRKYLEPIPELRREIDRWLIEGERAAVHPREQELIAQVKRGYQRFSDEMDRLPAQMSPEAFRAKVRELIDGPLDKETLRPAQAFLDFKEEEIAQSNAENQRTVDHMALALLALGICGPVSGLLAGFGIARGVTRAIGRLSVPIRDAAGKLNDMVGPITLSARWSLDEMEGVLHTIADKLGALSERFEQSQRELLRAEQLAAVGQLAAGMAHELRNPLMSMKILVQAAAERCPAGSLDGQDLTVLEEEIVRLERLVQTFMDFARPPRLEKQTCQAQALVEQVVHLVSGRAEQQNVTIDCQFPEKPLRVRADKAQLCQLTLNLLLNALDAMPTGGNIRLEMQTSGAPLPAPRAVEGKPRLSPANGQADVWLILRVADTGCGLPKELGERIFEPFVSTKETGIGLGLSICRRISEAHDGKITAEHRPGGGAVFTVVLPFAIGGV